MTDPPREPIPEEPLAALAAAALKSTRRIPNRARSFFDVFVLGISPTVPYLLSDGVRGVSIRRVVAGTAGIAYLLGLVTLLIWTHVNGTLVPRTDAVLQFGEDIPNLLNYTFIVPAYAALGTLLILVVLSGENEIRPTGAVGTRARYWWFRIVCAAFTAFTAAFFTANYFAETLNPSVYRERYWFVDAVTADGARSLGALGIYFAIVNFSLLVLTIAAIIAFIIAAARMYELGVSFRKGVHLDIADRDSLRQRLRYFTSAYIVGKLLAAMYMLNMYTWKMQAPEGSLNFTVAGAAVSVIGVFFIATPRYWVELQWYWYGPSWARQDYNDIRPGWMQWLAHALDTVIIGGFVTSFWL